MGEGIIGAQLPCTGLLVALETTTGKERGCGVVVVVACVCVCAADTLGPANTRSTAPLSLSLSLLSPSGLID